MKHSFFAYDQLLLSTRTLSNDFTLVRKTAMNEMAQRGKKATDAAVRAAQQTSTAMQYLQMQQQQLAVRADIVASFVWTDR